MITSNAKHDSRFILLWFHSIIKSVFDFCKLPSCNSILQTYLRIFFSQQSLHVNSLQHYSCKQISSSWQTLQPWNTYLMTIAWNPIHVVVTYKLITSWDIFAHFVQNKLYLYANGFYTALDLTLGQPDSQCVSCKHWLETTGIFSVMEMFVSSSLLFKL